MEQLIYALSGLCLASPILAQTNSTESMAPLALYDSTGGANWTTNANWPTSNPVATWLRCADPMVLVFLRRL